ncbi:transposable element Tcb1 transposase [Trichonephila clavipes]|nr:transposable element Tcb1 transposase [Trichonephila clavipes]
MAQRKHLDDFLRGRIIGRRECGRTHLEVSEELGIAQSVIFRLWQRFQDDGNVSTYYNTGRPRVTTPYEDRYLAVTAKRNRRSTEDLSRQLSSASGTTVSRQTVYRRLGHIGVTVCLELAFQRSLSWHYFQDGDPFNSCQVIYSQFGLAIHQNDHQVRRRFVEWAQNEIAVVPDFHKRILFSDEVHFWLNGYVNKQNCGIWSEANPQVYVEIPLHPEKLTVWCALWAGGILLQKR